MGDNFNKPAPRPANGRGEPTGVAGLDEPLYGSGTGDAKAILREVGRILRRGKWIILLVTMLVTGLVGTYVFFSEASYEAYTILLVEDPSQESGEENPLQSGRIGALDRDQRNMTDQTLLLQQSLPIAKRTVRQLRQSQDEIDGPVTVFDTGEDSDTSLTQTAERLLEQYVSATLEDKEKGNALRVTATSTNPHEAAFIANTYTKAYVDRAEERSRRRITAAQSFLEEQVARQEQTLKELEEELADYQSRTRTVGLEEETRQMVTQMGELEANLDEARVEKRRAEAALQSVQSKLEEIRPKLAERVSSGVDEEIDQAQRRIAELEARLEQIYIKNPELSEGSSQQNETVAELKDQIAGLRQRVSRLTEQYIEEMMAVGGTDPFKTEGGTAQTYVAQLKGKVAEERVAISGAEARIEALQQRLGQYGQRMEEIPERFTQIARLQRDKTAAEETYATLSKKLQDIRLAKEATISMAEIVRPALVPENSVLPRNVILLVGLFLGLLLGVVVAVGRHKFDTRIYTPEDLEARDYRSIGVVPDLHLVPNPNRQLQSARREDGDTREELDRGAVEDQKPRVAAALEKPTAASEAYRRLHLNLQLSRNGDPVRTVMVTSPEPGAGKSTTALNLAATAARAGRRTLIVDADFRQQQIQAMTGSSQGASLEDLLAHPQDEVAYSEFATVLPNLYAISQRGEMTDAGAGFSSPEMERLFERLRSAFDLVVFDTPPVLAVADAIFLSTRCDATLIVVQAGKTEVEELEQTSDDLRDARAEIVGTVLNRFNPSEPSSYTSYYQYQDYAEAGEDG